MLATPTAMRLPSSLLRARTPAAMLLCRRTMQPLQPLQPLLHRRAMSAAPPPPSPSKAAASTGAVIEITNTADFEPLVMAASSQNPPVGGPVIVDFYADWCQPCKQLTPALEKLVVAAQGAVRLAKVNVDNLPELAAALQVRELPTVMAVHKGKLVESFKGGLPPDKLKEFVDRVVALAGGPGAGLRVAGRFRPSLWAQGRDREKVRIGFGQPCANTVTRTLSRSPPRTGPEPKPTPRRRARLGPARVGGGRRSAQGGPAARGDADLR